MSAKPKGKSTAVNPARFEIKSAQLPLVAVLLKSIDWPAIAKDLEQQFGAQGENPDFFEHDPVVIDFAPLTDLSDEVPQLDDLFASLQNCNLVPVGFRGEPPAWTAALTARGLVRVEAEPSRVKVPTNAQVQPQLQTASETTPEPVAPPPREIVREVPGPATLVIDKPLRSGQKVYARGGDLVVLAMVNQGAEVVADGNIHVYAPLRGKAMAGARGNTQARIFSLCLEPELVSIAGVYRTSENPLPPHIAAQPAQIRLSADGQDKLIFESLKT